MSQNLQDLFDDASGHLALGELAEAAALYQKCVELDPTHFDSWHALSMALLKTDKLKEARTQNRYWRLVLVAPPRFLGLLRSSLDGPTAKLVTASLDKDLAAEKTSELAERLGEMIAL